MTTNPRRFPDLPDNLPPNLEFVFGLSPSAMTLGLGNIRALLERLGNPERRFRSVLVAGTNGKGSVTAMLASILTAGGLRVGRFISPHVYSVTERVSVEGQAATVAEMEEAAAKITPLRDEIKFSYFEALTAIAFLVFQQRGVDIAVLETGLGGRFDATNAVEPELSVITGISLDHRRLLGDSEEEILREKLGITRPGVPLLLGRLREPLEKIVRERSTRDGFPLVTLAEIADVVELEGDPEWTRIRVKTDLADYGELRLPFHGSHQVTNAVLAIGAAEKIAGKISSPSAGLEEAYLPGRFERVRENGKTFVLDVAHNEEALTTVLGVFSRTCPRDEGALVLGLLKRKELFGFPDRVPAVVRTLHLISPGGEDAFTPQELSRKFFVNHLKRDDFDVMLWDREDERDDPWLRLLDHLCRPATRCRSVLVTGSHRVVEQFGKRLFVRSGKL